MGDKNKKGKLVLASKAPWMTAKKDTPNSGILLDVDNIRWALHEADKKKTAELKLKEYTLRLIKNNTKTTWRTYAADAMHGIGEGAMMLNPYTTGAYFGAKALNSATLGNATEAIANAGFAAMPWAGAFVPRLVSSVEAVGRGVNKGMQVLNSPLTGKWTLFGNKEVRLAPGYIGMNGGSPLETRPVARYTGIDDLIEQNTALLTDGTRVAGQHEFARALGSDIQGIVDRFPMDGSLVLGRSRLPGVGGVVEEAAPGNMRRVLEQNQEALVRKGLIPGEPIQANPNAPYRTIDDLIENNTVELEGGRRMAGVRNATRELGYNNPQELLGEVPFNSPMLVNNPAPGRFMLEETHPGGFRTTLEGKLPQLVQRGIIRETVAPKPSNASLSQLRGQVVKATDPRVADVPREELAKYGIGLDMSEGGTPYKFSDLFISPSDPVYGVTLSDFASKDPGAYNTAYWYNPNHPDLINVSRYYGAKLNRQALADEGRRIQLNNPINISGSFGALKDYDLNVLSYLNAMRNMLKQQKIGRQIHILDPKLNTHTTERPGYIRMNELFQGPRYDDSLVSPEFIEEMRNMFNKGEQTISGAMGQAPTDASALSHFLETKAGIRGKLLWRQGEGSRLVNPSKFLADRMYGDDGTFQGFKLFLNGKDAGFLRAVPRKDIFDNFMSQFDLLRNQLGLKLADPRMLGDGTFLGPKLTTITLKKGGHIKSKLIKRHK